MTYRDRRLAKAARLREWADKRAEKAEAGREAASQMAAIIPFGQPILVGHHSEKADRRYRERISNTFDRAAADGRKAAEMDRRADGIEAQAERAIYDDDPDVIDRLTARIAKLEADRGAIKAFNVKARKEGREAAPSSMLTNLSADIRRNKERLARLQAPARPRFLYALRRPETCAACGTELDAGTSAWWVKATGAVFCRADMDAAVTAAAVG